MMLGPLEFISIEFKGNKYKGEIVPALQEVDEISTMATTAVVAGTATWVS